jgi:16S rRNA (adenine1518-N6/adenine1519-N6)-dimethyltransferase
MRKKYGQLPNVQLINQDVLRVDFRQLLKQYSQPIIVSNLPYAISSLVMLNFLKNKQINTMYVMLQKEMVERISALPKHKQYNNLSALMQYYCRIEKLFNVNANNFYPVPLIDSIVIKLTKNEHPYDFKFDKFLQLAFHAKRKTLFNNLKGTYFSAQLSLIMNELKINQLVRAEALTSEQLYLLYTKITLPNQ